MPVQVVSIHVQADRGQGGHRVGRVQLEARQLDGEDLGGGVDGACDRGADVAHLGGVGPARPQDLAQHPHRGGLPVRARHAQPRAPGAGARLLEAPGELHFAPHLDPGRPGAGEHWRARGDARGHDDDGGPHAHDKVGQLPGVRLDGQGDARRLVEVEGAAVLGVEGAHVESARGEGPGGSLPAAPPSDDRDRRGEGRQGAHRADTHSA